MKNTAYRRAQILEALDVHGQVSVQQLSKQFAVSDVTIRNDLDKLEQENLLIRVHGGALKSRNVALSLSQKKHLNTAAKDRIAGKAASLIQDYDTILLDSGTTTFAISNHLADVKHVTVVTNALDIVNNLVSKKHLEVFMPGGYLKEFSMSLVGPMAERNLRQLNCSKLFLGVDSIKSDKGLFTHHVEEAQLNQIMIEIAEEVIVVCDSSKFEQSAMAYICPIRKISKIITDEGISPLHLAALVHHDVEVIIV